MIGQSWAARDGHRTGGTAASAQGRAHVAGESEPIWRVDGAKEC